jgi:hypothetical protein
MKIPPIHERMHTFPSPRDMLRDPALWAWIAVALLAIIPARSVIAGG